MMCSSNLHKGFSLMELLIALSMGATLTTAVVFLPMALVEGQGQFFMMRLAIPIAVSLGASLLMALDWIFTVRDAPTSIVNSTLLEIPNCPGPTVRSPDPVMFQIGSEA